MDWRRELRPGSFKGVPFETRSVNKTSGQRYAPHKFIDSNGQWAEPLGRDARSWTVDAFVIGNDYRSKRDALEAALDTVGLGILVDPFRSAEVTCIVQTYTVSEGISDGLGWARFSIQVEESLVSPWTDSDDMEGLSDRLAVLQSAETDTVRSIDVAGAATTDSYVAASTSFSGYARATAATLDTWSEALADVQDVVFGPLAGAIDDLGAVADALTDLEDDLVTLIETPANLMARLSVRWEQVTSLAILEAFTRDRTAPAPATASTAADQAAADAESAALRASLN